MSRWHRILFPALAVIMSAGVLACGQAATPPPPTQAPAKQAEPTKAAVPAAQSTTAPAAATSAFPITIKDDAGREVTIARAPQKIISISASNTEILYALGLENRIVGLDQYSNYPPSTKNKPSVGGYSKPDLEKIVAAEPDLIFGTGIHVKATLPELEKRKIPTVIFDPKDVKGVLERARLTGKITGQNKEAEALVSAMQARIDSVQSKVKGATPVRAFYEVSPELHTAGPTSFVHDVIVLAGGINIAAKADKEWPQMNQEALFLEDPEVILIADHTADVTPAIVAARPGWKQISAVKNNRLVEIEPDIINRPGPRVVDGLELVARALHPDRMK